MDTTGALLLSGSLAFTGWLTWFLVAQGAAGDVGPNPVVGIRTRSTRASPAAWEAGHRAALPWARRTAITSVAASMTGTLVLATSSGATASVVGTLLTLSGLLVLVVGVILATRTANRVARQVTAGDVREK